MTAPQRPRLALVVHSDLSILSQYQSLLSGQRFTTVVARDLPTALLAITQHYFDVAIVSSQLGEAGDGWPLAGVLHLVFPKSYIGVVVPGTDLLTLQMAINSGVQEVYESSKPPSAIVSALVSAASPGKKGRSGSSEAVQ